MMLYAELIQQSAGEMPHHGLKGRIPRVKGRGERHDDGTSLRNRLHILEMDKVQWRLTMTKRRRSLSVTSAARCIRLLPAPLAMDARELMEHGQMIIPS